MNKSSAFPALLLLALLITACGPSPEAIATMTASAWTPTALPTMTSSPTSTPTQIPTSTPTFTPSPTSTPWMQLPFTDTFDDNSRGWGQLLFGESANVKDGALQVANGDSQIGAIRVPLYSTPSDVTVQMDFIPDPSFESGTGPWFRYGVFCRADLDKGNMIFLYVMRSLESSQEVTFDADFWLFKNGNSVDIPGAQTAYSIQLPASKDGKGYSVGFSCKGDVFSILANGKIVNSTSVKGLDGGDLGLGLMELSGEPGTVTFDNLVITDPNAK